MLIEEVRNQYSRWWDEHGMQNAWKEIKNAYILIGEPKENTPFRRLNCQWKDNTKIHHK